MTKKILVIDGDTNWANELGLQFMSSGLDVRTALDGLMGIKQAQEFRPHLIILDLKLPAGGGLFVLERLKASVYTQNIPVMIVSGLEDESIKAKAIRLGIHVYFQKPCDSDDIIRKAAGIFQETFKNFPTEEF